MTQVLCNGGDYNILLNLESDTVLPGSFVNAEYNKPTDHKINQLNRLADMVNAAISVAVSNTQVNLISNAGIAEISTVQPKTLSSVVANVITPSFSKPIMAENAPVSMNVNVMQSSVANNFISNQSAAPISRVSNNVSVANSINTVAANTAQLSLSISTDGAAPVVTPVVPVDPLLVSTYTDIVSHFAPGNGKVFVTGYTDSKFTVIDKYFTKTNVAQTRPSYRLRTDFVQPQVLTIAALPRTQNFSVSLAPAAKGYSVSITPMRMVASVNVQAVQNPLATAEPLLVKSGIRMLTGGINNMSVVQPAAFSENRNVRIKIKFHIPGLNYYAMILNEDILGKAEYVLYLDTENPIKYVDLGNGLSIFTYLRRDDLPELTANMVLFNGYIEEPKILSEVFIDRGLNSAFENVKKLKNIKNLNELTKSGLGFYKINTKGYNFKNV